MPPVFFWTLERLQEANTLRNAIGSSKAAVELSRKHKRKITSRTLRNALSTLSVLEAAEGMGSAEPPAPVPAPVPAAPRSPAAPEPHLIAFQRYKPKALNAESDLPEPAVPTDSKITRIAVIPDTHVPSHDRTAWNTALAVIRDWKPHRVVIIGDFGDLSALSTHPRSRPDLTRLASEFYAVNLALDQLQAAAGNIPVDYIEGNHERRAIKFANEFGSLDGLLTVPEQLFITPRADGYRQTGQLRGVHWIPYEKQPFVLDSVAFAHGHHCTNKHHAAWHADVFVPARCPGATLFYGHMHTFQSFQSASGGVAHCTGFLGDMRAPEMGYIEGRPTGWVSGLTLVEVRGEAVTVTPVRTGRGTAVFHGWSLGTGEASEAGEAGIGGD